MAKLHFRYATMNSGKSIDLMRIAHNYEENGLKVLILKPAIDTKAKENISSRIGIERKTDMTLLYSDDIMEKLKGKLEGVACILIDESQFLSTKQVDDLFLITKACDIPVVCYGLRNNFRMEAFAGSKRLLEIADTLETLKTLCICGKIARFVGRKVGSSFVKEGEEVVIDGETNITYVPLCGSCYLEKVDKVDLDKVRKEMMEV